MRRTQVKYNSVDGVGVESLCGVSGEMLERVNGKQKAGEIEGWMPDPNNNPVHRAAAIK